MLHCYYVRLKKEDLDSGRALTNTARIMGRSRSRVARLVENWIAYGEIRLRGGAVWHGDEGGDSGSNGEDSGDGGDSSEGEGESDGEGEGR